MATASDGRGETISTTTQCSLLSLVLNSRPASCWGVGGWTQDGQARRAAWTRKGSPDATARKARRRGARTRGRTGRLERRPAGRAQGKTQVAHLHLLVSLMCKEGKRLIWSNPRLTGHHWLLSFLALNIDLRATLQSE